MTLTITLTQDEGFAAGEVASAVTQALERELKQAQARRDYFARECRQYEEKYGMTSAEFFVRFEAGELGDDEYLFDWYGAKRAFDTWDRQVRILSGVSVERS